MVERYVDETASARFRRTGRQGLAFRPRENKFLELVKDPVAMTETLLAEDTRDTRGAFEYMLKRERLAKRRLGKDLFDDLYILRALKTHFTIPGHGWDTIPGQGLNEPLLEKKKETVRFICLSMSKILGFDVEYARRHLPAHGLFWKKLRLIGYDIPMTPPTIFYCIPADSPICEVFRKAMVIANEQEGNMLLLASPADAIIMKVTLQKLIHNVRDRKDLVDDLVIFMNNPANMRSRH